MRDGLKGILKKWELFCLVPGVILIWIAPLFNGEEGGTAFSGILFLLGFLAVTVALSAFTLRFARLVSRRVFHKVRNRIIATYILAGVLPLLLALTLFLVLFHFFMVQLASSQFRQSIGREFQWLEREALRASFHLASQSPGSTPEVPGFLSDRYSHFRLAVRTAPGEPLQSLSPESISFSPADDSLLSFFAVFDDSVFMAVSVPSGEEFPGLPCVLAVPLRGSLLASLERELGGSCAFTFGFDSLHGQEPRETGAIRFRISSADRSSSGIQFTQHPGLQFRIDEWSASQPKGLDRLLSFSLDAGFMEGSDGEVREVLILGLLSTRYSHMAGRILQGALPENVPIQKVFLWVAFILAAIFVAIELVALIISLVLSRSITRAIAQLRRKAEFVARGDFTYRIDSKRSDQLGLLATSFDTMSDSLELLLEQVREKERLENELAIAQEVQRIFFPRSFPRVSGIRILGSCKPAQMVSGDYYDCIHHSEGMIDFFIGDISGKGISAALLMAGSQTFLRSEAVRREVQPVHEIIRNFNNYLVDFSGSENYTSLFYGRIDPGEMTLTFCNAGHPAPFLFREGSVTGLSTGGLIPGVIPDVPYLQETISLLNGDLIVAFTDGLTEVFDSDDREFGEERLSEAVKACMEESLEGIWEQLVRTAQAWSTARIQADDMTVLMVRVG